MTSRRDFLKNSALCGALLGLPALASAAPGQVKTVKLIGPVEIKKDAVILFQGDSITDAGRARGADAGKANHANALGRGYPFQAAAALLNKFPDKALRIFNRGISGNKIPDLAARWEKDTIALKPDILSILVGVNDYWHTRAFGATYKGTIQDYEDGYRALLRLTKEKLPNVKLIIGEPFVIESDQPKWAVQKDWFPAFDGYRDAARKLAGEFDATLIPYQSIFDEAVKRAPKSYWSTDGVHPTNPAGTYLMAQAWLSAVK